MTSKYQNQIDAFINEVKLKDAHEPEFIQAVQEVAEAIIPFMNENPKYKSSKFILASYSTEGNIPLEDMMSILGNKNSKNIQSFIKDSTDRRLFTTKRQS